MARRVADDARIDPRIREFFDKSATMLGLNPDILDEMAKASGVVYNSRDELLQARMKLIRKMMTQAGKKAPESPTLAAQVKALWSKEGLHTSTKELKSLPDGNTVKINFVRPANEKPLPLVVYFHGGGMASGSAFDPQYKVTSRLIARNGVAVAMVDFRNCEFPSLSNPEVSPFPAGLNDCYSALLWCHDHASELGVDRRRMCIAGESGGGNLTIAVALKCKREGRLDVIPSGFFSMCPYIAGIWPRNPEEAAKYPILGTSHIENHGVFLTLPENTNAAMGYGIEAFKNKDPLAWPGFASVEDLQGLPRCVISVNECDPLRDEGINFYRRLLAAGVSVRCQSLVGTPHGGDLMVTASPDIAMETARAIAEFACGDDVFARTPLPPVRAKL